MLYPIFAWFSWHIPFWDKSKYAIDGSLLPRNVPLHHRNTLGLSPFFIGEIAHIQGHGPLWHRQTRPEIRHGDTWHRRRLDSGLGVSCFLKNGEITNHKCGDNGDLLEIKWLEDGEMGNVELLNQDFSIPKVWELPIVIGIWNDSLGCDIWSLGV